MKKLKSLFSSEQKLAKVLFSVLVVCAFGFVFGPNLYAQFARQDGGTGWGYGYGYGYGYDYGFDAGRVAGYKTDFTDSDEDVYGWGYGYGYLPTGVTYDADAGYSITEDDLVSLVYAGIMVPDGADITNTTSLDFQDEVTMTVNSVISVNIPSGTTFTAATAGDFSAFAASETVTTTDLSGVTVVDALQFGLPDLDITVDPAITISVTVGTSYNGLALRIYRKDVAGTWAYTNTDCTVSAGVCSFTTTHLSDFATGTLTSSSSSSSSSGGGAFVSTPCTGVVYGEYGSACVNGYQSRSIITKSPNGCETTLAQQVAQTRACTVNENNQVVVTETEDIPTSPVDTVGTTNAEKALVTYVNKALTNRLAGRILLQVEAHGESWYVNPLTGLKYFMGRPADAFSLMRKFGLGISNKDFNSFKNNTAPARLSGRILLKVEDFGKAYYVNPVDLKMHYLGRPADAYQLMRTLGLGITNKNIRQIAVGEVK
ncbi:MAG: hypothetical protein WCT18_04755 [Patescibacteria group bacterium]